MSIELAYSGNTMSLIVAVRDDQDIVLASDGRVLDDRSYVISEHSLKTLALNHDVCLGLAGPTYTMRQVLTALGVRCHSTHPIDLLGECQEAACPVDVDYSDARDEITKVLGWMGRHFSPSKRLTSVPSVILAGKEGAEPALSQWAFPVRELESSVTVGYSHAIVGSLPDPGSQELAELHRMVQEKQTTVGAEERLAKAVRFCAEYFGMYGPINKNVSVRRMSRRFGLNNA
jgi:hypothetical protein